MSLYQLSVAEKAKVAEFFQRIFAGMLIFVDLLVVANTEIPEESTNLLPTCAPSSPSSDW